MHVLKSWAHFISVLGKVCYHVISTSYMIVDLDSSLSLSLSLSLSSSPTHTSTHTRSLPQTLHKHGSFLNELLRVVETVSDKLRAQLHW